MRHTRSARLLIAVILASASPAVANDTLATLGAGGLVPVKSSSIVMESEELEISPRQVVVRYVFRNTGDHDADLVVAFPLPELDGGLIANSPVQLPSKDPLNFVDFRVRVGGKSVAANVETRAFFYGKEITADLRALGVPASVVDKRAASALSTLPLNERARLKKAGWLDCALSPDGKCWPLWQTRIQFYWTQRFPARTPVEVVHTYRPVVGGSYITADDDGALAVKPYCGNPGTLDRIKELKRKGPLRERRIQYILTTANNWSGPIRRFHLSVIAESPRDILVTCLPGLERTAPTRYQFTQSDFRPGGELELLLLESTKKDHGRSRIPERECFVSRDPFPDPKFPYGHNSSFLF